MRNGAKLRSSEPMSAATAAFRVRMHAGLRERAGARLLEISLPEPSTVDALLEAVSATRLGEISPGCVIVAVNREYVSGQMPIRHSDEIALIPPVSGGAA